MKIRTTRTQSGKTKKPEDYLDEYLNAEGFEYDHSVDPLYSELKKHHLSNSEKITEDILGKYSQMSGGGGVSSAAISAAGQAGRGEMSKLLAEIPELYELAYEMYENDLKSKREKYEAALEYEKYKELKSETESGSDDGKEPDSDTPVIPDEPDKLPKDEDDSDILPPRVNTYLPLEGMLTPDSITKMNTGTFNITKALIGNLINSNRRDEANKLYSSVYRSMSASQRSEIEKIIYKFPYKEFED